MCYGWDKVKPQLLSYWRTWSLYCTWWRIFQQGILGSCALIKLSLPIMSLTIVYKKGFHKLGTMSGITKVNLLIVNEADRLEYIFFLFKTIESEPLVMQRQAVPCKAWCVILSNTLLQTCSKWYVCMFDEHLCLEMIDNHDQSCAISRLTRVIKFIWWSSCKDWTIF